MALPKKLFITFIGCIVIGLIYVMIQQEHKTFNFRDFTRHDVQVESKQVHYVKNRLSLEHEKQIQKVMFSEIEELKQRGLDISNVVKSAILNEAKTSTTHSSELDPKNATRIENDKVIKHVQKNSVQLSPKNNFRYFNPDPKDIEKLTPEQKSIEIFTDPIKLSASCSEEYYLVVAVVSSPGSVDRREAIRNSWAYSYQDSIVKLKGEERNFQNDQKYLHKNVFKTVFIIGHSDKQDEMSKVMREAELHKDIVLGNLQENYRNLTMKTRLAMKWAFYDCKSVYFLKTDDDVFVNPVPLVEWLKQKPEEKFYTGFCNFFSPVVRNPVSKWYISESDYSGTTYPGYCLGGGYLMSTDVLGAALKLSYGRKLFPMEDIYVGLLINELGNIKIQDERRHFDLLYTGRENFCDMNELFLAHRVLGSKLIKHIKDADKAITEC